MVCLGTGAPATSDGEFYFTAIWSGVDVILLSIVIFSNSFVVFSVVYHRIQQNRGAVLKETSWSSDIALRFVLNLAVADTLVGLATVFNFIFFYSCSVQNTLGKSAGACMFRYVFVIFTTTTSGYSVIAIAADRYVAIILALRYQELMNHRNVTIIISVVWFLGAFSGMSVLFTSSWDWEDGGYCTGRHIIPISFIFFSTLVDHSVVAIVVIVVHVKIHREVIASDKRRQSLEFSARSFTPSCNYRARAKSARVLVMISTCYILCWLPFLTMLVIVSAGVDGNAVGICFHVSYSLTCFNYALNPIVYAWKNKNVRKSVMGLLQKCKKQRENMTMKKYGEKTRDISSTLFHIYPSR